MPQVTAGQTASGLAQKYGGYAAFLKANPSFAAQPGETKSFMGLTGNIKVGQNYVIPGQEATANPVQGSANYAENLTKSFDQGGTSNPNAVTGTSDAVRQQALDKIKADLQSGLTKPTPFSSVDTYTKLRTEQGVVQDENEMNAIQTEKAQIQNDLNNYKASSGAMMTEAGRLGNVSEKERNANERLDSLAIQEQSVTARLNTKNSYISNMVNLGSQDYKTALDSYNTAYNNNLKAIDLYNTQMTNDRKDAMTGFTTITNLLKDNNVNPSTISPALKAQLDSLTLKAGLPSGIFDTLAASHPDAKILAPIEVANGSGGKDIYFFTQDPKTGQPTLLKTFSAQGGGGYSGGSSGTINANGQSVRIPNSIAPYAKTSYSGISYADLSGITNSTLRNKLAQDAQNAGIVPIFSTADAGKINAISDAKTNLNKIQDSVNSIKLGSQGAIGPAGQGLFNSIAGFFGNTDIKSFNAWRTAIINNVQALAGGTGSGLRINKAEIDAAMQNDLPVITGAHADTQASAKAKLDKLNSQLDTWEKQLLGGGNTKYNQSGGTIQSRAQSAGYDYSAMHNAGYSDAQIDAALKNLGK